MSGQGHHGPSRQQSEASQPNAGPKPTEPYKDPNGDPKLCANCWTTGHTLKDCTVGHVHTSAVPGCPVCNVPGPRPGWTHEQAHHFDDCQKWERSSGAAEVLEMGYYPREPRFKFLVQGRAKKPAIRTINHFFLDVFLENARTMSPTSGLGATPAGEMFPWTDKFAMERSRFRHEENVGVDNPFWAGKTVRDVMTMYNRNPQSLSHLRYIPAAQAKARAQEKMVIRYALKKALMDCQLWVSTEVKRGNQNFVVDRVKLPTDEGFGDLQPVDDPKSRHAEAEDDMKIKQEAPHNVDAADDTAPGEAAVTRGYYKTLTTIQDDTSLTYGSTYSEDNSPPPPRDCPNREDDERSQNFRQPVHGWTVWSRLGISGECLGRGMGRALQREQEAAG